MLFGPGRIFLALAILAAVLVARPGKAAEHEDQAYQLQQRQQPDALSRVKVLLEVEGKLDIKSAKSGNKQLPMSLLTVVPMLLKNFWPMKAKKRRHQPLVLLAA